eukprot:scaffold79066_cov84-Attheya_sp.AAC.1
MVTTSPPAMDAKQMISIQHLSIYIHDKVKQQTELDSETQWPGQEMQVVPEPVELEQDEYENGSSAPSAVTTPVVPQQSQPGTYNLHT